MARVDSVNVGIATPNPYKPARSTGIAKIPQLGSIEVRPPGSRAAGLGSGLVSDHVGDRRHHGGDEQAVYAFAREDLDRWEERLGRTLTNGSFGENLTTLGLDISSSRLGERWRVGSAVELQVTCPRIPCATFRGWMQETGWLRTFTADGNPGAYLSVVRPGRICAGETLEVVDVPAHDVTISLAFRAITTEPELLPSLLAAEEHLCDTLRRTVSRRVG